MLHPPVELTPALDMDGEMIQTGMNLVEALTTVPVVMVEANEQRRSRPVEDDRIAALVLFHHHPHQTEHAPVPGLARSDVPLYVTPKSTVTITSRSPRRSTPSPAT